MLSLNTIAAIDRYYTLQGLDSRTREEEEELTELAEQLVGLV